jgi:hypothetical protein
MCTRSITIIMKCGRLADLYKFDNASTVVKQGTLGAAHIKKYVAHSIGDFMMGTCPCLFSGAIRTKVGICSHETVE